MMVSFISDLSLCFNTISDRKEKGFSLVPGLRRVSVNHGFKGVVVGEGIARDP